MNEFKKEPLRKVQIIALSHYSRRDIQNEMFEFCKNRETVANFNNKFFEKRPNCFDYPSDILNTARSGATSFHCSEELWKNPMDISTDMTPEKYNEIRTGWDFLIDIDSKYLDYSKIAARLLIKALNYHGIKNIGIKFSGSKGFHLIIPFKAFPKELDGIETKNKFPEWPRLIAGYLKDLIKKDLIQEIINSGEKENLEEKGELAQEHLCPLCNKPSTKKIIGIYKCPDVKCQTIVESMISNRKEMVCNSCFGKMKREEEKEIYFCEFCKINTAKIEGSTSTYGGEKRESNQRFIEETTSISAEESVDLVLVSPRHLFRAPYSLHEKTALASIVIESEDIEEFKPSDADPLKINEVKSFMPNSIKGEAKELLLQALDFAEKKQPLEKKYTGESIDLKGLTFTEEMFPPEINLIMKGIKTDGRKRALSFLLSFFTSLEFPRDYIEEKITEWNKKNYHPLKEGYIKSQIDWHTKNKRLPPNYGHPTYKLFGINGPPEVGIKNPINYTIKLAMKKKWKEENSKK